MQAQREPLDHHLRWVHVQSTYAQAVSTGAVEFAPSTIHTVAAAAGFSLLVMLAPSLAKKPQPNVGKDPAVKPRNPFLPHEPALFVGRLPPEHKLLLNKYTLRPCHLLVVTEAYQQQESRLTATDLGATWQTLEMLPASGISYFNCGPLSGKSQPHKHLQVLPLPLDAEGPLEAPVHPLVMRALAGGAQTSAPTRLPEFPFGCWVAPVDTGDGEELERSYNQLLAVAGEAIEQFDSYSFVMTK